MQRRGAAHAEYISRLNSIEERLVELNKVLDNHAKQAEHNWGHVGDLGMIDDRLADLLSGFSAALKA